jgi:hypothetical protein
VSVIGTGIEHVHQLDFTLYPNPGHDNLFIDGINKGQWLYRVFDLMGNTILQNILKPNASIAINGLLPGMYVLKIENESASGVRCFVKR